MSAIDIGVLLILAITILGGVHRGFLNTLFSFLSTLGSLILSLIFGPLLASGLKNESSLYSMLLYYTEGAEYVANTDVELTRQPVSQLSAEQVRTVVNNAELPIPMGRAITKNIATEAFAGKDITTLGDYFNMTIVSVVLNILSVLLVFIILRIILGILVQGLDYGKEGYPVLVRFDAPIGAGVGLIEGIFILFAIFLIVPVILTVIPQILQFLQESFFGDFFYRANFILYLIPSV